MATYYKKKDEVSLRPGQTLGYTAGKGYYAAGTPTPPKPPPAAAAPAKRASAAPTGTRPVAANMPTAPEMVGSKPTLVSPTIEAADLDVEEAERSDARAGRSASSAIPKLGQSTAHYEHAADVPIRPGQTLAFAAERGYYAAGRPNPTKAPTTPAPSTTKITALSTRGSTESPLREHVETRDGRTTIRLSHATTPAGDKTSQERQVSAHANERSATPSKDATHRTDVKTKKASSRVHEQVAKNKDRSDHSKPGDRHHPGRAKRDLVATAASAGDAGHRHLTKDDSSLSTNPLSALPQPPVHWERSVTFPAGLFTAETTVQASTGTGMKVRQQDDEVTVKYEGRKLFSMSLGTLGAGALHIAETAYAVAQKFNKDLTDIATKTVHVDGGDLTISPTGVAYTKKQNGVTTTIKSSWGAQLARSVQ